MKKVVRGNIWETNSSSDHSVSLCGAKSMFYRMDVEEDGYVHSNFDNYGWYGEPLTEVYQRLRYILTMAAELERKKDSFDDEESFYQTESFKMIEDAVKEHVDCKGIIVDDNGIEIYESKYYDYVKFNGGIDHQSCEDYSSLDDFLTDAGIEDVSRFIFDDSITVNIDNDNH